MTAPVVTCTAPVNIALVKYWGKRDEELVLPINSSLSVTLHQESLRTKTSVAVVDGESTVRMWLNGDEVDITSRISKVLAELRLRSGRSDAGFRIVSENNFPTAAGLASSAAGLACLVFSVAEALGYKEAYPGELSTLARMGSGSACRSLQGGFVAWDRGTELDGSDSIARQVVAEDFWSDVRILVCVVDDHKKSTSSTSGMRNSVETSELLEAMEEAIHRKDFPMVAEMTMRDSNQFHAICLDTTPPIFYLNDTSKAIIRALEEFNALAQETRAAYTFDAGPNAVILCLEKDYKELEQLLLVCFPPRTAAADLGNASAAIIGAETTPVDVPDNIKAVASKVSLPPAAGVRYFIKTRAGPGPQRLSEGHLISPDTLLPS